MISVAEAKQQIITHAQEGPIAARPLADAVDCILAESLPALVDIPAFDNSAMDGFALRHTETTTATPDAPVQFPIAGQQLAGTITCATLPEGCCAIIATGARVPTGATAVIPLEDVTRNEETIAIRAPVKPGACLRRHGEEIRRGEEALSAGTRLTPAALGFLAGVGHAAVPVAVAPRIGIIPTGSELLLPDQPWTEGHIYDSSTVALQTALREWRITPRCWSPVPDDPARLRTVLEEALHDTDYLMITGGCSVGSADYLKELLRECDVQPIFWQVRQKPGKPLYFGRRKQQLIFGLPGNPVSSLVCYYEYVRLAIQVWMGDPHRGLPTIRARASHALTKSDGKAHFLRAHITVGPNGAVATPIGLQESHRMRPFAQTNGLIVVPEETTSVSANAEVEVHLLPGQAVGAH